jgi:dUTP pyrophosphatase
MEKNKQLEEFLKKLQELDRRIDAEDTNDDDDLMIELNKIITSMSKDIQMDLTKLSLYFVNTSTNPDPEFTNEGDSGFDLRANLTKDIIINEGSVRVIPTGLYFEVNKGLEVQIRTRRKLAENTNIMVLNSPGTVNSGCREEIKIILANFGDIPRTIRHGDKIAQGVVCPVYGEGSLNMVKVEKLSETVRNKN